MSTYSRDKTYSVITPDMKEDYVLGENNSNTRRETSQLNIRKAQTMNEGTYQTSKLNLKAQIFSKINKKGSSDQDNYA